MNMEEVKIAWGITGAGDKIKEIKSIMKGIEREKPVNIEVFISKAGEQVLKWYKIRDEIEESFEKVWIERNSNSPFLAGNLQTGKYETLIIAPTTSNSVAKIAHSIGDTLLTNSALMALKAYVPVYILPTDLEEGETDTELPNGKTIKVRVREEDAEKVKKLRGTDGVHIIEGPEEIEDSVDDLIQKLRN